MPTEVAPSKQAAKAHVGNGTRTVSRSRPGEPDGAHQFFEQVLAVGSPVDGVALGGHVTQPSE